MKDAHADDRDAIRHVLETDIQSFLARDRDAWADCWCDDPRFHSIMECGTMQVANTFDAFRRNIFDAMDSAPDPVAANVTFDNLRIEVAGNVAWATYEETIQSTADPLAMPSYSHNFRLLEKSDGRWRILFHGCWAEPIRDIDQPAIEVSRDRHVLWKNAAADAALTSFRGLTISHGKLRASRTQWDADLQKAVSGAHNLTGFGDYNRANATGDGVSFPVVLGETDDGGLLLCWAKVVDGRVYILFGGTADLSRQIMMAQAIYGLSDAQTRIVDLIANGKDLSDAAEALGVTKNTARTHLRRVYEKAGVGSQIELLRLIISFAA